MSETRRQTFYTALRPGTNRASEVITPLMWVKVFKRRGMEMFLVPRRHHLEYVHVYVHTYTPHTSIIFKTRYTTNNNLIRSTSMESSSLLDKARSKA